MSIFNSERKRVIENRNRLLDRLEDSGQIPPRKRSPKEEKKREEERLEKQANRFGVTLKRF